MFLFFWISCRRLHIAIISEFVQTHVIWAIIRLAPSPWLLDIKNDYAQAPIHLAVLTGQSNVVRRLLIAGAKVSYRISLNFDWMHHSEISKEIFYGLKMRHFYISVNRNWSSRMRRISRRIAQLRQISEIPDRLDQSMGNALAIASVSDFSWKIFLIKFTKTEHCVLPSHAKPNETDLNGDPVPGKYFIRTTLIARHQQLPKHHHDQPY